MQNYNVFVKELVNMIEGRNGVKTEIRQIQGNDAIVINTGSNCAPVIYTDHFYQAYLDGAKIGDLVEQIEESIATSQAQALDISEVTGDYSKARGNIIPKLVHQANSEEIVAIPFLNMFITFIYVISRMGDQLTSFQITKQMLSDWGISEEQLKADAISNAERKLPAEIHSIGDVLGFGGTEDDKTFYVLSNPDLHFGAVAMLYNGVLDDFAKALKADGFSIIPSSVHEVLLVPDVLNLSASELKDMLIDVNTSVVREDEVLSDTVYRYQDGHLDIAS